MHATDILLHGHRSLTRSLQGIEGPYWSQAGVCGVWTAKDVIAHLASYEKMLAEVLGSFLGQTELPTWDRYQAGNGVNDAEVADRRALSPEAVLAEYGAARETVDQRIRQLPAETLRQTGSIPWYGEQYDLEDYVVYVGYGHKREHAAQFNAFKDILQR